MYLSLILLGVGAFLKSPSLFDAILLFGAAFSFVSTAKAEEALNIQKFGDCYAEYCGRTKMFIPFIF